MMLEKVGFLNHEISRDDRLLDISTCLPTIFIFKQPTGKIFDWKQIECGGVRPLSTPINTVSIFVVKEKGWGGG